MLRLQRKTATEIIPGLHYKEYSKSTNTLHSLGEKLSFSVSISGYTLNYFLPTNLIISELFGTGEEDAEEFDNTEDSDNGMFTLCI